jgi:hypothetical protein
MIGLVLAIRRATIALACLWGSHWNIMRRHKNKSKSFEGELFCEGDLTPNIEMWEFRD